MSLVAGIRIVQTIFKFRKQIYRTIVAQDRAIDRAFKIGGYGRQTRYGARHGALVGSLAGSFIGGDPPVLDSAIPQKGLPSANNQYKKRGGNIRYNRGRNQYGYRKRDNRCRKRYTRGY